MFKAVDPVPYNQRTTNWPAHSMGIITYARILTNPSTAKILKSHYAGKIIPEEGCRSIKPISTKIFVNSEVGSGVHVPGWM